MRGSRGAHHGRVGALHPQKTAFDLSFEKKGTCEMGKIIPIMCQEAYPGEFWDLGVQSLVRLHPQVAPMMHEVQIKFHDFFVPMRLLWKDWREFITGGATGVEADNKNLTPPVCDLGTQGSDIASWSQVGSLWDYIYGNSSHFAQGTFDNSPIELPLRAYWLIWNEYYRDENFEPRKGETQVSNSDYDPDLLGTQGFSSGTLVGRDPYVCPYHSWVKDYFTSALPFQQRGVAPAFPVSTTDLPVTFDNVSGLSPATPNTGATASDAYGMLHLAATGSGPNFANNLYSSSVGLPANGLIPAVTIAGGFTGTNNAWSTPAVSPTTGNRSLFVGPAKIAANIGASFDVSFLRYAVQVQKILERNARGGVRYNEWIRSHFGANPRDERLQRPEYIGGAMFHLSVSEVLQTSQTDGDAPSGIQSTPQGTMAGHAMSTGSTPTGKYRVQEHGYIMRMMFVQPTPAYEDGMHRSFFRRHRYDYLMPELVNLSEQGIFNFEMYVTGDLIDDTGVWGYQPQYDELRINRNEVCGELRVNPGNASGVQAPSLSYWHLGRSFSTLPPLGANFILYDGPTLTDRVMAVSGVHPCIFSVGNVIRAVRPLPYIGEPGLVDHH